MDRVGLILKLLGFTAEFRATGVVCILTQDSETQLTE